MVFKHDYHQLTEHLLNIGAISGAAELQAYFCGQFSVHSQRDSAQSLEDAVKFLDLEHFGLQPEQLEVVEFLRDQTRERLKDDQYSFQPLLPGDEISLERRAEEVANWCKGYLHGFGSAGLPQDIEIPSEVAEILKDFAKIAQVEIDDESTADDAEAQLTELSEYLRVGLFTIQAEMQKILGNDITVPNQVH